ncbi:MAG TPA: NUDIX domain-containing protein [Bryobacteraceae bacterium]|nr:NUDIX domain-containing protein [Bryobacteraceae bacterium]
MTKRSAGFLMFRRSAGEVQVFLVHPGGPFWKKKDLAAWSLPKGEYPEDEDSFSAATREFEEETGIRAQGPFTPLGQVRQPGGKLVTAWAFEGDCDPAALRSNRFSLEWPKGSGRLQEFPEIDRGAWFGFDEARRKILKGQAPFLDRLARHLGAAVPAGVSEPAAEGG